MASMRAFETSVSIAHLAATVLTEPLDRKTGAASQDVANVDALLQM
jgi:hypothetical protein